MITVNDFSRVEFFGGRWDGLVVTSNLLHFARGANTPHYAFGVESSPEVYRFVRLVGRTMILSYRGERWDPTTTRTESQHDAR